MFRAEIYMGHRLLSAAKESTDSFKMALKTFLHSDAADVFDT